MDRTIERELVDRAVPLLGTAIGMIMEDHADQALTISAGAGTAQAQAVALEAAGRDIAALAAAITVLLRRAEVPRLRNPGRPALP